MCDSLALFAIEWVLCVDSILEFLSRIFLLFCTKGGSEGCIYLSLAHKLFMQAERCKE